MPVSPHYQPAILHPLLGEDFYDPVSAANFPDTILRYRNDRASSTIGLDGLTEDEWLQHFGRFKALPDNIPGPLALRYMGHQFRSWNPDLGDGRGFLFAQMRETGSQRLLDLSTKGSGQTPWSRAGDGRLTLKGGVREILATEMLEALGVNTSKTLSIIETGEALQRNDEPSPTRSAVMVRLVHSSIRIGSFQRQAALGEKDNIMKLVRYSLANLFADKVPDHEELDDRQACQQFYTLAVENCARMSADWMVAGFVHGVLNSDNVVVTGESFDYGPWRFLPHFDPQFTAAYFDYQGLYAYGRQPASIAWNLQRLGECLLWHGDENELNTALDDFQQHLDDQVRKQLFWRLGITTQDAAKDDALIAALFNFLLSSNAGFAQVFHDWYGGSISQDRASRSPQQHLYKGPDWQAFTDQLDQYQAQNPHALDHHHFKRIDACDMLIDEVEEIWDPIAEKDDWSLLADKLDQIADMRDALNGR